MILVSACLLGVKCRYNGKGRLEEALLAILPVEHVVPVCPEQLGGLQTPRAPAEIAGGDGFDVLEGRAAVINTEGISVTDQFIRGADEVKKIMKLMNIDVAIMKERSPSCGVKCIKKNKKISPGTGVTSALLIKNGIKVISSDNIEEEYVRNYRNR
jgi:uncharacterized protein YbbK (DUF523 family)